MKRCRLLNEHEVRWLRNPLYEDGRVYCNPSTQLLESLGYWPLVDSPRGEERPGFVQMPCYQMVDSAIGRIWKYQPEQEEV